MLPDYPFSNDEARLECLLKMYEKTTKIITINLINIFIMSILVNSINSFLKDFKKENHVTSPHSDFFVDYYAIKDNGEYIKTSSQFPLESAEWGLMAVNYGVRNYRGYIDSETSKFLFKKDGSIGRTINFGKWEVNLTIQLSKANGINIEFPKDCDDIEGKMLYTSKILPWIINCTTKEEVDAALAKFESGEDVLVGDMTMNQLVERNKELEQKVQQLEKKLAAIMSVMNG